MHDSSSRVGSGYGEFELEFGFEEGLASGRTIVENAFLMHYMPKAPGNAVKVYLAGLMRCFGYRDSQFASVPTLAKEQGMSERAVQRALSYWEKLGLIRRVPRYLRDLSNPRDYRTEPDAEYKYRTSNLIVYRDRRHWLPMPEEEDEKEAGNRTDVGRGDTGVTGGGDTGVTQRITNREQVMSEGEKGAREVEQGLREQAAASSLPIGLSIDTLPIDEPDIDYAPIVAATERAGILVFAGGIRNVCEMAALKGMDERVIALCIDDAKALESQKSARTPMWKWAAAFVRSAFEAGVRTVEDYARFKQEKAAESKSEGSAKAKSSRSGHKEKNPGWYRSDGDTANLNIDWSKWGQPGHGD